MGEGGYTKSEIVSGSVVLVVDVAHGEGAKHLDAGRGSHGSECGNTEVMLLLWCERARWTRLGMRADKKVWGGAGIVILSVSGIIT